MEGFHGCVWIRARTRHMLVPSFGLVQEGRPRVRASEGAKMRRGIVLAALLAIGTLSLTVTAYQGGAQQAAREVTVDKVRDNLWVLRGGGGNTAVFVFITITIAAFGLFTQIDVMTRGGPLDATSTVIFQAVEQGFRKQDIAYGSAISVVFFVLVLVVALVQRYLTRERR